MRLRAVCRPRTAVGSFLALLLTFAPAWAAVHTAELTFKPSQFHTEFAGGSLQLAGEDYEVVLGDGMDVSDEPGAPQLPVEPAVIALPGRQLVTAVTFEAGEWKALAGEHNVLPVQKQQVLVARTDLGPKPQAKGQKAQGKTEDADGVTQPDPAIYGSNSSYPSAPARWTGTSYRHDSTFVQVLVYPVRYIGAEGRVEVCGKVKVKVEVEGRTKSDVRSQMLDVRSGDAGSGFEYVIVTGQGLDTVFQRLADWKTQKGVPTVVRTMDWVYANYTGRDHAEQLRNYLKTLPDSGVRYVLLGGDVGVVPFRKAYAMNCQWGSMVREDSLPCDLYFADLDGSWDANNNNVFGEVDDAVDLYADLSVGRAPVNNVAQAQTFVRKVLDYERAAVPGYQNKGLFFAEVLWQNPYTDMGVHKNKMEQQSFASGYALTKLYQSLGNETRPAVMQAMRENQSFMNHDGHGWIDVMECGGSANRMFTADADTITNAGLGVLYSIGCWTTAFDFTSIGEAFVTNPNGGTVATIGNSSYGWGSPGNPGFGYSDKFDNHFWHAITSDGIYRVGDALAAAKEYYAPFSHDQNVYRWHQYDVNLMGDPEMPVWTALPETMSVATVDSIGLGNGRVLVTVMHGGWGSVRGALVCLMKGSESYSFDTTDATGQVWLDATPRTVGDFTLTVTAHNYLPVQQVIPCAVGPCVSFAGWTINDSLGNNDGIVNRCERFFLSVRLQNSGSQASGPIAMRLHCDDWQVSVEDWTAEAVPLAVGDTVLVRNAFRVLTLNAYNGEPLRFDLSVSDGQDTMVLHPVIIAGEPVLALDRWWLTKPTLEPGQTGGVGVRIANTGFGYGYGTWCTLSSLDSNVSVLRDSLGYGRVSPQSLTSSADSFVVAVSPSCPAGHTAWMLLHLASDDFKEDDSLELLVGEYGFSDNMESGESKWTHAGAGDLWHLTSHRTHSGASAWYCGNEASRLYNSRMDASLMTVPFIVPQGCSLRFWRWFRTPNYGVDGLRVIIMRSGAEETLDFLGTGGALGRKWSSDPVSQWSSEEPESGSSATRPLDRLTTRPLLGRQRSREEPEPGTSTTRPFLNESGWAEEKYDLSWLRLGEQIGLRFAFVSDGDTVDEGFYIDDVSVTGGGPPVTVAGVEAAPGLFPGLYVWPNPFRSVTQVRYGGSGELPRLSIYGAAGQLVRRLPAARIAAWDGRDDDGRRLPAGAYFIEARTQSERRLAKVLLVR
jgi:hypothetical protein